MAIRRVHSVVSAYLIPIVFGVTGCSEGLPEQPPTFGGQSGRLREELRIDGQREELSHIIGVAVGRDGTIAILQPQAGVVRFFTRGGEAAGDFGRPGPGPGEFEGGPSRLGWRGDTLWVYDNRRITFITPTLQLGRMITNIRETVGGFGPDGWALIERRVADWPQSVVRADPTDSQEVVLIALPTVPRERVNVRTQFGNVTVPFANLPIAGFAPDGSRAAGAMASLDGPDAGTFSLTVVGFAGDTLIDRRYAFDAESVSRAEGDSVLDARIGTVGARYPDWEAAVRGATHIPPTWPPFQSLLVGNDGSVWMLGRERVNAPPQYYVVAANGNPVGIVALPQGGRLGAASLDRVWVVEADELGVESVVQYAVDWV